MRRRIRRAGFTLIEMAVTLLVIGIVTAALIPRLPDPGAWRLKSAARKLAATITYVYNRSAATQLTYRLTLDIDGRRYFVSLLNTDRAFEPVELAFARETALPPRVFFADAQSPAQGKVNAGAAVIHFMPTGFVEPSEIHLKDEDGAEFTLRVNPLTGEVTLLEGHVEWQKPQV